MQISVKNKFVLKYYSIHSLVFLAKLDVKEKTVLFTLFSI